MKNILLIFLPVFFSGNLFSQTSGKDKIILLDGKTLNVIVIDANEQGVKYKLTMEGEPKAIKGEKVFIVLDESGDQMYYYGCGEYTETNMELTESTKSGSDIKCGYVGGLDDLGGYWAKAEGCSENHFGEFQIINAAGFDVKINITSQANYEDKYNISLLPGGERKILKVPAGYYCYSVVNTKTDAIISKGEINVLECMGASIKIEVTK